MLYIFIPFFFFFFCCFQKSKFLICCVIVQVLMETISLRRTKDKGLIGLPPKTLETCYVELSGEERELYDQMEGEAKSVVRSYIDAE